MEIERMDDGILYFYVDEEYLKKYGLEIETFRKSKPFKVDIFDSLLYKAEKEYGAKFVEDTIPQSISVKGNVVIFEVKEESKVIPAENKYTENEMITRGILELFRTLPDKKISIGITDADKKRELLQQIRNDESMQYIWENFMY